MTIYVFEVIDHDGWGDWGATHMSVIAKNEKEAWRKACQMEYRENIIGILRAKEVV